MTAYLLILFLVAGEAVYESIEHRYNKTTGKYIEGTVRGVELLILAAYLSQNYYWFPQMNFWAVIGLYISVRIAFFRTIWNEIALDGIRFYSRTVENWVPYPNFWDKYLYIGKTDPYDKFLAWICFTGPLKAPPQIFLPTWETFWFLLSIGFANGTIIK